jgi:hypothetical protein
MRPADTSREAWKVLMDLVRRMPPEEKLQRALALSAAVRQAGEAGIRQQNPGASEREILLKIARIQLGPELARLVYENGPAQPDA